MANDWRDQNLETPNSLYHDARTEWEDQLLTHLPPSTFQQLLCLVLCSDVGLWKKQFAAHITSSPLHGISMTSSTWPL